MQIFQAAQPARSRFAIVTCHKLVRNLPGESQLGHWELKASFQNKGVAERMMYRALNFTGCEVVALVDRKKDSVVAMSQRG